jgi:hypothetical protein
VRRTKLWLIVAVSCLLLSLGLVFILGQPDETERLLRRYGPVTYRYIDNSGPGPSGRDSIAFQTEFRCADPNRRDIDSEFAKLGWIELAYSARSALYHMPRTKQFSSASSSWREGRMHVRYSRPATSAERFLHRLKAAIGIEGSRAP